MEDTRRESLLVVLFFSGLVLFLVGTTWFNYHYLVDEVSIGGDSFVPRWMGSRLFVLEGVSPYSEDVGRESQQEVYGRLANPGEDPLFYLYPLYSFFLFFPFTFIANISIAAAVWMTILQVSLLVTAAIMFQLTGWKISRGNLVLLVIFCVIWFYSVYAFLGGNIVVLVALLVVGFAYAVRSNLDFLAGVLLAFTTIKAEVMAPAILFCMIWFLSTRRWLILGSFFGSLGLLILSTIFLLPDWIMQNFRQLIQYYETVPMVNSITQLGEWLPGIGRQFGWGLAGLIILVLVVEWRYAIGKGFRRFFWVLNLTLVGTILVGMPTSTINFVILLPGSILIFLTVFRWWSSPGRYLLTAGIIALMLLFWGLLYRSGFDWSVVSAEPVYFFTLPVVLMIALYWIRWWATQKQSLPHEDVPERVIEL
jgi:hypothetical protein